MSIERLARLTARTISQCAGLGADHAEPLPGLWLIRHRRTTTLEATLYEPVICLGLSGRKQTTLGARTVEIEPGQSMIVSHELPVVSQVTEATDERPYLALVLRLDVSILRSLSAELAGRSGDDSNSRSLTLHSASPELLDAFARLLKTCGTSGDVPVLAPLIMKEIHYRLLSAPHGGMLRQLIRHDSHASQVARAIAHIRSDFKSPLVVTDLASSSGMSASSFHKQFKAVTGTTPLRYQKDLRLLEARRLLVGGGHSVTSTALAVGYASPTQFSREYSRKFGVSPSTDASA